VENIRITEVAGMDEVAREGTIVDGEEVERVEVEVAGVDPQATKVWMTMVLDPADMMGREIMDRGAPATLVVKW